MGSNVRDRKVIDEMRARAGTAPSAWEQAEIRAGAIRAAREHRNLTGSDLRVSLEAEQRWLRVAASNGVAPSSSRLTQRNGAGLATVSDIGTAGSPCRGRSASECPVPGRGGGTTRRPPHRFVDIGCSALDQLPTQMYATV